MARTRSTSTAADSTSSTKKTRTRKPSYYKATLVGNDAPVIVVATTYKTALEAVLTLVPATHGDLVTAGKEGHQIIDTTVPEKQASLIEKEAA